MLIVFCFLAFRFAADKLILLFLSLYFMKTFFSYVQTFLLISLEN